MHENGLCHRDIKLDNLMIYSPEQHIVELKIIDFGFACSSKDLIKVFYGTPAYMAPELVSR